MVRDPWAAYFTADGLLHTWPSRKRPDLRSGILQKLANEFETDRIYSESEVNVILKSRCRFDDHVLLRRELVEARLLSRTTDGRQYWRVAEH